MCCSKEGLNRGAEECLVHVLDPVLYVGDCVDVVGLMRYVSGGWSNAGCGEFRTAGCGEFRTGCNGQPPQISAGVPVALQDKAFVVPDAACGVGERRRASCVAESADGDE